MNRSNRTNRTLPISLYVHMTHTVHHLNTNKPSREHTPRAFSHRGTLLLRRR
jgi:hypothetical protein